MSWALSRPSTYPNLTQRLLAANGQDTELNLPIRTRHASPRDSSNPPAHASRRLWHYDGVSSGSINSSGFLASFSLTHSNKSSAEPRVAVSNNDCAVKFRDVNVRGTKVVDVSMVHPSALAMQARHGLKCP